MEKDTTKIIISVVLFLVFGGLTVLFTLVDLDLSVIRFSSVKGVIAKREELLILEDSLKKSEEKYESAKNNLAIAKKSYDSSKAKYEAISDQTIDLIREATTEENYDIEYMWIKLGNYASMNNLSIVMLEPGATSTKVSQVQNTDENTNKTTLEKVEDKASQTTSTGKTMTAVNDTLSQANESTTSGTTNVTTTTNTPDTLLTVTVEGSYLNMSDFIFEVENDKELRFKLDNIEITYVSGTTIRAKFNVKNVIVLK